MKKLIFVIFAVFLTACASAGENTQPSAVPSVPSSTLIEDTPTPLPSATLTPQPDYSRLTTQCVEILDQVPDDVDLPGVLVLYDSLLNLETGYETRLARDWYLGNQKISPDGEKIAASFGQKQVQLFNAGGGEIANIYVPGDDWLKPAYWINSNMLVLYKDFPLSGSGFGAYSDYSAILNIDTGNLFEIPKETFPDFHPYEIGNAWNITKSVISPDGRYVVYATTVELTFDYIVLWGVVNHKVVE
jgi:hypothetical protein